MPIFVIQEHHARALHWDVRLERDGVLVSWAVPKGLPLHPADNRLAVFTTDHELEYADHVSESVLLWDRGQYELEEWSDGKVKVVLHGTRVDGRYVFFRTRGRDWIVHRMTPAVSGWTRPPRDVPPMLATPGRLPPGGRRQWAYDFAWGGVRLVLTIEGGRVVTPTPAFPELRALGAALGSRACVLDGEVIVRDDPFGLARRTATDRPGRALLRDAPITYLAYDLLHLDGQDLTPSPHRDRRALLSDLTLTGPHWTSVAPLPTTGRAALHEAHNRGLPGIVAKRHTSPYLPGAHTPDWLTISFT